MSRRWALVLGSALVTGGALSLNAFAEPALGTGSGAVFADPAAPEAPEQREAELTPAERLTKAGEFVAAIEEASRSIQQELQAARKDRDVVRVLCLNDKVNQVDVALSSARDRLDALRAAVEHADADRSRHEFTILEVLNDRSRALVNESSQCVGEETGFIGDAEVSLSVDPNLPNPDTETDPGSSTPPPPPDIVSPIE